MRRTKKKKKKKKHKEEKKREKKGQKVQPNKPEGEKKILKRTTGRELYRIILYWSQLVFHVNKNQIHTSAQKDGRK